MLSPHTVKVYPLARGANLKNFTWDEIGGLSSLKGELKKYVVNPILHQEFGVDLWTGILLYGPNGTGKSLIAQTVAHEAGANLVIAEGIGMLYEIDKNLVSAMSTIFDVARANTPCILFFEQVDVYSSRLGEVFERILCQLLIELGKEEENRGVYVIGATDRPDLVDEALLTPRGFGKLLHVPLPSPEERGLILKAVAGRTRAKIDATVDLIALGNDPACENFSGNDLTALIGLAALLSMEKEAQTVKDEHFKKAFETTRASACKEYIELSKSFSELKTFGKKGS